MYPGVIIQENKTYINITLEFLLWEDNLLTTEICGNSCLRSVSLEMVGPIAIHKFVIWSAL